jgi:hypothetical protein
MAFISAPAFANNFCNAQTAHYREELDGKTAPVFKEINQTIEEMRQHGTDPEDIRFKTFDGSFKSLPEILRALTDQKAAMAKEIDAVADKCAGELKPYQDATEAAVSIAFGGLDKLLPTRMTHVEIGEILAGKPFGGEGGVVPHLRNQLLNLAHIDVHTKAFVPSLIIDPWKTLTFQR